MSFMHSIKFRFTIWYLLVLTVLLTALSAGVYFYLARGLHRNLDGALILRSTQLRSFPSILDSIRQGEFREELGEIIMLYFYSNSQLVQVSPRDLTIPLNSEFISEAIGGRRMFATVQTPQGERLRLLAVPLSLSIPGPPPSQEPATLVIARSTEQIHEALARLVRTFIIAIPLALLLAAGGGIFLASRALKPVEQIARTAQEIGAGDLSRRISVTTQDELGRLAATLNHMIGRLENAFQRQKQFTGDASHDLRAPLAIIEAESTLALQKGRPSRDYRQSLEIIARESRHMSSLIDRLLTLARADAGNEQWSFTEVDLVSLVGSMSTDIEVLCHEKGLSFHLDQGHNLLVKGDEAGLRQLLMNLVDNTIRYTPSPGTVSVSSHREGQMAVITITDTGIGIPAEDMPFIFERFYRVDKSRPRGDGGSGLGLAICRHIAEIHGARIEVQSQVGKGSTFSIRIPLYSP